MHLILVVLRNVLHGLRNQSREILEGKAIFQNYFSPLQISYPNVRSSIADAPKQ